MSENFFALLNDFQDRRSSTQQSAMKNKSDVYYLIIVRSILYGIMLPIFSKMKFRI